MKSRSSALDATIFGVDVQSGDIRGSSVSFALVILEDGTLDRSVVTHRKLLRSIESMAPDLIAIDNVFELAADKSALVNFLGALPAETNLVQVTGAERPESLSRVANRHGVPYEKEPMAEAEAAARLAALNVGQVVRAFDDETTIKVSRGRATGKGGWSEDRHTRRIHGAVKRTSRSIESTLDSSAFEYTHEYTEKYGGYSQAIFSVDAPPEAIPVSSRRSGDVRVEIDRPRRGGIEYEPLVKRRDHVIVGLDPGTTTGVALVGLEGRPLETHSTRTGDIAEITEWIIDRGRPVIVASDVTPMPDGVDKLRRRFEAAPWTPQSDLPVEEKLQVCKPYTPENDHERDALAAALAAHDAHADQFERIDRKVPTDIDTAAVTARVLQHEESVEVAIDALTESPESETTDSTPESPEPRPETRRINRLESQVSRLESLVERLREDLREREEKITTLESELEAARRHERMEAMQHEEIRTLEDTREALEDEIEQLQADNEALEDKLERLKALWRLDHSDFATVSEKKKDLVPVKPIEKFTEAAIDRADEAYGLAPDDVIWLEDATGAGEAAARRLAALEPRVVLKTGGLSEVADRVLFEADIPLGNANNVTIQRVDELAVARESAIEAIIEEWEAWASERRREQRRELVDELISKHRAESNSLS